MAAQALIINADDLGLWPTIDAGILAAWRDGAISDSSVFATAPLLAQVLRQTCEAGLPVGVHLNLTYGAPLSPTAEIPALLSPAGMFRKRQTWTAPLPIDQVRLELTRQVERVLALGVQPSHLDSHHHVHAYAEVLTVVIELAHTYQLPVRATSPEMRLALREAGIATPDCFSMAFYGVAAMVETLITLYADCPGGVLEIMTHPGYVSPELPGSYREERQHELDTLTHPRWRAYVAEHGIAQVGFASLQL